MPKPGWREPAAHDTPSNLTPGRRRVLDWSRGHRLAFIENLRIEDKEGQVIPLNRPTPAQRKLVQALGDPRLKECWILKGRQTHFSTGICAHIWHDTYSRDHPYRTLTATNHNDTTRSIFGKYKTFYNHLPRQLQRANPFAINHSLHTIRSEITGALLDHLTVGGTGQGRGWTYQRFVAEECAFPPWSASTWGTVTATVPDDAPVIGVSTPNGPGNFYHGRIIACRKAVADGVPGVHFIFSPWHEHPEYRRAVPDSWEPSQDDLNYAIDRGVELTLEQLYWRYWQIWGPRGSGDPSIFQREYPGTEEDGFVQLAGAWFDVVLLNALLNALPAEKTGLFRIYAKPDPRLAYVAGVDPSWCNGGDYAACTIYDQYGRQVAVYATNKGGEHHFAMESGDLIGAYKARHLTEANKGGAGKNVIQVYDNLGLRAWKQDGKHWTTTSGNKQNAYGHARRMVNGSAVGLRDHATIRELCHIREENNTIEGRDGENDDLAMATVLALWNLRTLPEQTTRQPAPRQVGSDTPFTAISRIHKVSYVA